MAAGPNPEVYGEPVYDDLLPDPEVYGEAPLDETVVTTVVNANRLYFPKSGELAAPVSPAFDASWEGTSAAVRVALDTAKRQSGLDPSYGTAVITATKTVNNTAYDVLLAQFVSPPLNGDQTISGAIKGIFQAAESSTSADASPQMVIRVVSNDGTTVRGTLIASDTNAIGSDELLASGTTQRNAKYPKAWTGSGQTPTSVNALDGDRIVIEVGVRGREAATTSRTFYLRLGNPVELTDLAENQTDQTTSIIGSPWVEFADTLSFAVTTLERVSQLPAEVLVKPDTATVRVSQLPTEALVRPDTAQVRVSQLPVEVLVKIPTYRDGELIVAGSGAITQAGENTVIGAHAVTGTGALDAAPTLLAAGALAVAGAGTFEADGDVVTGGTDGALAVTGTGTLGQSGQIAIPGAFAVTGSGTLAQTGELAPGGALAVTGTGALAPTGSVLISGALAVSGSGSISLATQTQVDGELVVSGSGTIALDAAQAKHGALAVSGSGTLASSASVLQSGRLAVTGRGTLGQFARADWSNGWPVTGTGRIDWGGELVLPASAVSYHEQQKQLPRVIVIKVNGVDVTDDVRYADAVFTSQVNGTPGDCSFAVRDLAHTRSFTSGQVITVHIDGKLMWRGFVRRVKRQYSADVVDTTDPSRVARWFLIEGADVNLLLSQRLVYYKPNPAKYELKPPASLRDAAKPGMWREDAPVADVVKYIITHYTDLLDDGVSLDGVVIEGTMNPDDAVTLSAGQTVADFLRMANRLLGGIFYLTYDLRLVFRDVETATTNFRITDTPDDVNDIGPREYTFTSDASKMANDALVWGTAPGVTTVRFGRAQDTASQDDHGRWQVGEYSTSMYKQASIDTRANAMVYGNTQSKHGANVDRLSCEATIFVPLLFLGDVVWCESATFTGAVAHDPPFENQTLLRAKLPLRRMAISFPTSTSTRFSLLLTEDIDEPWSIYEFVFRKLKMPPGGDPPRPPLPETIKSGCTEAICGITDAFTRTVSGGWGTSDAGLGWQVEFAGQSESVDGVGHMVTPPTSVGVPFGQCIMALPVGKSDLPGFTFDFMFDYLPDSSETLVVWGRGWIETWSGAEAGIVITVSPNASYSYIAVSPQGGATKTSVPPSFWSTGTWYSARWSHAGDVWTGRVWKTSEGEATAYEVAQDMTGSGIIPAAPDAFWMEVQTTGSSVPAVTVDFDNLDISGVTRCDAAQFDDFNRSVASGWGTSTSGDPWTNYGPGGYTKKAVEGGYGKIEQGTGFVGGQTGLVVYGDDGGPGRWKDINFSLLTRLKIEAASSGSQASAGFYFDQAADPFGRTGFALTTHISGGAYDRVELFRSGQTLADNSISLAVGSHYLVRYERTADTHRVRFWPAGSAEPSTWNLEQSGISWAGADDFTIIHTRDSSSSLDWKVWYDYIEFDYTGKPCYDNGCGNMFDDFERTVAAGSLGATPAGYSWVCAGSKSYLSVNGSAAVLSVPTAPSTGYYTTATIAAAIGDMKPWVGGKFTVDSEFRVSRWGTNSDYGAFGFGVGRPGSVYNTGWETYVGIEAATSGIAPFVYGWSGGPDGDNTVSKSMTPGAWYRLKAEFDPGVTLKVKMWPSSGAEPAGWDIESSDADTNGDYTAIDGTAPSYFYLEFAGGYGTAKTVECAWVSFDRGSGECGPCVDGLVVDSFSRTVAQNQNSPSALGAGEAGVPWYNPTSLASDCLYSANGSYASVYVPDSLEATVLTMNQGGSDYLPWYIVGAGVPPGLFGVDEVTYSIDLRFDRNQGGTEFEFSHADRVSRDIDGYTVRLWSDVNGKTLAIDGWNAVGQVAHNMGWTTNTWYTIKVRCGGNSVSAKAWKRDVDPEPETWHVSCFIETPVLQWEAGEFTMMFSSDDQSGPITYDIDNFVILDCTSPSGEVSTVPAAGPYCETLTHSGGTHFATAKAWWPGSLVVYINGTRTLAFTANASLGEFTLSSAISASDTLRVCYQVNGDPA